MLLRYTARKATIITGPFQGHRSKTKIITVCVCVACVCVRESAYVRVACRSRPIRYVRADFVYAYIISLSCQILVKLPVSQRYASNVAYYKISKYTVLRACCIFVVL